MQRGKRHIEDFGAIAIDWGADRDQPAAAMRTANRLAILAAIAWVLGSPNGGEIEAGPGVYLTNGFTGIDTDQDLNVNLVLRGVGSNTLIQSNNLEESTLGFRTTGGNLRNILVENLTIRGGREGLSLLWVAYSTFRNLWCWGSKNFALQNEAGNGNLFHKVRFDESAQGTSNGTLADAALFIACEDTLSDCNLGEFSGGLILDGGSCVVDGGIIHDCTTRRAVWHSYTDNTDHDLSATLLPMAASIIVWQGSAVIQGINGNTRTRFVTAFRAYELVINGIRMQTEQGGVGFTGFVNVITGGGTKLALNISGCSFVWIGNASGYFIADPDQALDHAMVSAQLTVYAGSSITPLGTSAPALLNPNGQDNLVTLRTFTR